eukprot:SM000494S17355  [mRNA]  locus=s494:91:2993:+ [translate_table: standard]
MGACLSSDKPVAALGPSSTLETAPASAASAEPPTPAEVPLEAVSAVKGVEAAKLPRTPRALSPRGQQLPPFPPSGPAQGTGAAVDAPSLPAPSNGLVDWAKPYLLDKRRMYKLLDTRLEGNYSIRAAARAVGIATACLNQLPKERPSMSRVVKELRPLLDLKDMAVAAPLPMPPPLPLRSAERTAPLPMPPPPPLRSAERTTSWPLSQKGMENADLQAPSVEEQKREEMEQALPRVNSAHNGPARRLPATIPKFGSRQ